MPRRFLLLFLLLTAGCRQGGDARSQAGDSLGDSLTDGAKPPASSVPVRVTAPDASYDVQLPSRYQGAYRVDSLSSAERGTARPGALNIVYLPRDTTLLPQTLVVVAVYDAAAWAQVARAGGPPPGDSVASQNGRVYVLALPQSNPFAPGSADAFRFDSLALTPSEKQALVRVR